MLPTRAAGPDEPSGEAPATAAALTQAVRAAARFDRRAVSIGAGLLAAIPVVALLAGGLVFGDKVAAVTTGAGAMLVGIAWRTRGGRPPLALMATDAALMALSTFVGCVTGASTWAHLIVLCVWSLLAGLLVALGARGAVLGTQAIIAVVVFGRFSQPAAQALGLAGFVLAGGLAQVMFLSVVRWPTPLRAQREATAAAYRELARIAAGPALASTLPAASALDDAQSALASGSLFGDSALMTLRSLVSEGLRLRVQITAIHALIERARAEGSRPMPALVAAASSVLAATAAALGAAARAITGEEAANPELSTRVAAVTAQAEQAAELAGLTPGGTSELRGLDPRRGAGEPAAPIALRTQIVRRLAALAGQLRAVESLAPAAGHGGGLRSRRPHRRTNRPLARVRADLALLRANASLDSPAGRHALRLAIVVPGAELIARELPLQRSYWMVVAAATVLRPEFGATFTRGSERALGTSLGVALAGALTVALHPTGAVTVVIVGLLAWAGYAVFPASFAIGFAFITTLTVFLLNAISPDTLSTAAARLLDTLVGGALGLIVFAAWPTWSRRPARHSLANLVGAQRAYIATVLGTLIDGRRPPRTRFASVRGRTAGANEGRGDDRGLAQRSRRPPDRPGLEPEPARVDAPADPGRSRAAPRRPGGSPPRPMPALAPLAENLDELLGLVERRIAAGSTDGDDTEPPDLRGAFSEFTRDRERTPDNLALANELDEIVDAAGGLATLVGIDPADPPGCERTAPSAPGPAPPSPAGAPPTPAGAPPTPAGAPPSPAGAPPTPAGAPPTPGRERLRRRRERLRRQRERLRHRGGASVVPRARSGRGSTPG